jgi:hypothetical protein
MQIKYEFAFVQNYNYDYDDFIEIMCEVLYSLPHGRFHLSFDTKTNKITCQ